MSEEDQWRTAPVSTEELVSPITRLEQKITELERKLSDQHAEIWSVLKTLKRIIGIN